MAAIKPTTAAIQGAKGEASKGAIIVAILPINGTVCIAAAGAPYFNKSAFEATMSAATFAAAVIAVVAPTRAA